MQSAVQEEHERYADHGDESVWTKEGREMLLEKKFMVLQRVGRDERPKVMMDGYESEDSLKKA